MVLDLEHLPAIALAQARRAGLNLEFVSACPGATLLELILVVAKFRK